MGISVPQLFMQRKTSKRALERAIENHGWKIHNRANIDIHTQASTTYRGVTRGTTAESRRMPATRTSTKLGVRWQIQRQGT